MYDGISKINLPKSGFKSGFNDYPHPSSSASRDSPDFQQYWNAAVGLHMGWIWTAQKWNEVQEIYYSYRKLLFNSVFFMFSKEYLFNGLKSFRVLSQVFLSGLSLA